MEGRDCDCVWIDLDHDVRIVGEPDRTVFWEFSFSFLETLCTPELIDRSGFCIEEFTRSDRLEVPILSHLPFEIFQRDHLRESRMVWCDMIIITIYLHEALPVIVAVVILGMMVTIILEAHILIESDISEISENISFSCEEEPSPFLETPSSQIHTWFLIEMRCADHLTREVPCPLMEWARDRFGISLATVHDRLTVTTDIRDELYPLRCTYEHASIVFMLQGIVVSDICDSSCMSYISWPTTKKNFELFVEYFLIEVDVWWEHTL